MADLTLAEKDAAIIKGEMLAAYKAQSGRTLGAADPVMLFINTIAMLFTQLRSLIDFAGKQSILQYVTSVWIGPLGALWGETRAPAKPSRVTVRFTAPAPSLMVIPAGKRVTDGRFLWSVVETSTSAAPTDTSRDVVCECTATGIASNGVGIGQIVTMVDSIPGVASASNITESSGGADLESVEAFRERLRTVPEARSTAGPRAAYEELALAASSAVADAVALGPDDGSLMAGTAPDPSEVFIAVIEGTRDGDGNLLTVVPEPTSDTLAAVTAAVTPETVRPIANDVTVQAARFIDFDVVVNYYIGRSRSKDIAVIQAAVEGAFEVYLLWQQSKIGRDINPDELRRRLLDAGAKRLVVSDPSFTALKRDESGRVGYVALAFAGLEDD